MIDKNTEEKIFELNAEFCKCLASPIRLKIIHYLRDGEKSVEELIQMLELQKANVSQHLTMLKQHGVVTSRKAGLSVYYSLKSPKLLKACDIVKEILYEQLQENGKILEVLSRL